MNRIVEMKVRKSQRCGDAAVVAGLKNHSRKVEEWFYETAQKYFNRHFKEVFFDLDKKQEIYQSAFLKLWTEIDNGIISVGHDGVVERRRRNGDVLPMTCSLTTFLMAFAKNEYRELVRTNKLEHYDKLFEQPQYAMSVNMYEDKSEEETKHRIVDECIQKISPRCVEILTMFYYEEKSLDEILAARHEKNTSKNGLKTAKNKCMNTLRSLCSEEFKMYNI